MVAADLPDRTRTVDLIGQFGIGLLSAYIVAARVEITTRSAVEPALRWSSDGGKRYSVEPAERSEVGTTVVLHLKPDHLRYEELSAAYANMDLFVFPSHTDTFGNVVLEALASGVPAVVTPDGGPKTIVRDGETGRIVPDAEFSSAVAGILGDPPKHEAMRKAAQAYALTASWDSVFEGVYSAYEKMLAARMQVAG